MDLYKLFDAKALDAVMATINRDITFLADDQGQIRKIISKNQRYDPALIVNLSTTRNVFDLLGHKKGGALSSLINGKETIFPLFQNDRPLDTIDSFYTTLQTANLKIIPIRKGFFFCSITPTGIFPSAFPEKKACIIFVDSKDLLKGFNETFYRLFHETTPNPRDLLDRNLGDFLKPTPSQIQRDRLSRALPSGLSSPRPVLSLKFPEDNARGRDFTCSCCRPPISGRDGLRFPGPETDFCTVTLPESFNTLENDLNLHLEFEGVPGADPLLLLSNRNRSEDALTDITRDGYLLGATHHPDTRRSTLKKSGYVAANGAYPPPAARRTLSLLKIGNTFRLSADGRTVLAYFDPDCILGDKTWAGFAFRKGGGCLLRRCMVELFPRDPKRTAAGDDAIVEIQDPRRMSAVLNRFYIHVLNASEPYYGLEGYYLQDLTVMKEKLNRVTREYEAEVKRGDRLEHLLRQQGERTDRLIGSSATLASVREKAAVIADSRATVLIQGPTGSGKEVLARYIHSLSPFSKGPFVKVDCSTLPRELMESELFGHEKGAFTGAIQSKTGLIEEADRGTLFIDEAANLTAEAQKKLLHFLQDFTIVRVGGNRPIQVNLRVLSSANIPLRRLVDQGLFREDLYYRLNVVSVDLPPLAARKEDLAELCTYFVDSFSRQAGKPAPALSPDAFRRLEAHSWPGNIRELKNVLQRAVLFCKGGVVTDDLILIDSGGVTGGGEKPSPQGSETAKPLPYHFQNGLTREEAAALLARHHGNVQGMARELRVTPRGLYYFFKRIGLDPKPHRKERRPGSSN